MILADYGADVIKVEPPGGEHYRSMPAFLQWNRGKQGVVLDLKTSEGQAQALALAREGDVLIENFRPGIADRLHIGYNAVSALNPALVYLSISAFGQHGKYRDYKGYEAIVAAKCGQYVIQNGYRDDGPIYDAVFKCSYGASILGLIGILAALRARERVGAGQKVETTLAQANFVYSYSGIRASDSARTPGLSQVQGRDPHNTTVGYRIAQCADGQWIQSGGGGGGLIVRLMKALGIEEYFTDPRLQAAQGRNGTAEDRQRLLSLMDAAYKTKPLDEWVRILGEHDAAYGVFLTTQQFMDYPQVRHNGHVVEVDDPSVGRTEQIGQLAQFGSDDWRPRRPAPRLGEHSSDILGQLSAGRTLASAPAGRNVGPGPAALADVTVIDLSGFAAAPGGSGILADLGARVIKLEPPEGDPMGNPGELFFRVNRGKERLSVDLKQPEGRRVLHQLVARADVVMHNFRPGVPERLEVDYETLSKINPRLVYLYAASYGSSGPDANRPAFDAAISAMAGGEVLQAGEGNPPQQRQTTDHSALLGVALAMLLGLRARDLTGRSQNIETTMLASAAYLFSDDFIRYDGKPDRPVPDPGQYGLGPLYRLYRAREG